MYGDEKGFYEHTGGIRAVLSTTYPINNELQDARFFFYILSAGALAFLLGIVSISNRYINIIKSKQQQLRRANDNLTQQVDAQTAQISRQHAYLDLILNASPNIIIVSDLKRITFANDAFFEVFGEYENLETFNQNHIFKDYILSYCCEQHPTPISGDRWLELFLNRHRKLCFINGVNRYYQISTTAISHDSKSLYLHILSDITELERTKQKLQEQSIVDELTGLYNRRYFNTVYDKETKRASRENVYFVFAIMDIDFFKNYNDTLGHKQGDKALAQVASLLQEHFSRSGDYVFRMGGEEFSVITTTASLDHIKGHFYAFHRALQAMHLPHPSSRTASYLTLSVGVYASKVSLGEKIDFYKEADLLLYEAKEKRNDLKFNF